MNIRIERLGRRCPTRCCAKRDWVMASLHAAFDRNPTERILDRDGESARGLHRAPDRAQDQHQRGPRDVDIERVVAKALETGTSLEINAQPNRLDICATLHARLAGERRA